MCYDDDDDEESSIPLRDIIISECPPYIAITLVLSTKETKDPLIMRDEHLDTIPKKESDEFIKSSVMNLVPNQSEFEDEHECDVPICDDFTTFSNILFDADDDFSSNEFIKSCAENLVPNPMTISHVLMKMFQRKSFRTLCLRKKIIPMKKDHNHDNGESDLVESLRTHDSSLIISSKIDSFLDEFAGELTLLKSITPGIDKTDCDPEEDSRLIKRLLYDNSSHRSPKEFVSEYSDAEIESFSPSPIPRLLYDNSSPRPPEEFNSENSNAEIESFSPSPIPNKDSDSFIEEIDFFLTPDDPMPPSIEDDEDSKGDILFEKLIHNDPIPLSDTLDFSYEVRIFLPFFTYPMTSPVFLSYGGEDKIFDPGIT
nr:hypothetical protein [Tanacetum cinerariifolium]